MAVSEAVSCFRELFQSFSHFLRPIQPVQAVLRVVRIVKTVTKIVPEAVSCSSDLFQLLQPSRSVSETISCSRGLFQPFRLFLEVLRAVKDVPRTVSTLNIVPEAVSSFRELF